MHYYYAFKAYIITLAADWFSLIHPVATRSQDLQTVTNMRPYTEHDLKCLIHTVSLIYLNPYI